MSTFGEKYIYLVERQFDGGPVYDCTYAHVVIATGPSAARKLAAERSMDEGPGLWLDAKRSTCKRIGFAPASAKQRVVCTADSAS